MPVKLIQKQAPQQVQKPDLLQETVTDPIAIAVDQMIELEEQLAAIKPLMKEQDAAKKVLASEAAGDQYAGDQKVILTGSKGTVEFSPKSTVTKVTDMQGLIGALKAKIGYEALLALISISLTDAKQYLSEAELAAFVEQDFGSRRLLSVKAKE
jgi:hypothetical protein